MVQIIARGSKEGRVNLYARIFKRSVINNAVALGVTLSDADWKTVEGLLNSAADAQRMGMPVVLRDTLAQNLWTIKNGLDAMLESGTITRESVKQYVNNVLHQDIIRGWSSRRQSRQGRRQKPAV